MCPWEGGEREKAPSHARTRGGWRWRAARSNHPQPWISNGGHRQKGPATQEEEEVVQEWFRQLWLIPEPPASTNHRRHQGARVRDSHESLVWIRKDLWGARSFQPEDCFPVGRGDRWSDQPKDFNFAADCWAQGKKKTFIQAVQSMAGRERGRGRGFRSPNPEEDWGPQFGWMQPPPPQFYPQAPPPYGFYPNPNFPPPHFQPPGQ